MTVFGLVGRSVRVQILRTGSNCAYNRSLQFRTFLFATKRKFDAASSVADPGTGPVRRSKNFPREGEEEADFIDPITLKRCGTAQGARSARPYTWDAQEPVEEQVAEQGRHRYRLPDVEQMEELEEAKKALAEHLESGIPQTVELVWGNSANPKAIPLTIPLRFSLEDMRGGKAAAMEYTVACALLLHQRFAERQYGCDELVEITGPNQETIWLRARKAAPAAAAQPSKAAAAKNEEVPEEQVAAQAKDEADAEAMTTVNNSKSAQKAWIKTMSSAIPAHAQRTSSKHYCVTAQGEAGHWYYYLLPAFEADVFADPALRSDLRTAVSELRKKGAKEIWKMKVWKRKGESDQRMPEALPMTPGLSLEEEITAEMAKAKKDDPVQVDPVLADVAEAPVVKEKKQEQASSPKPKDEPAAQSVVPPKPVELSQKLPRWAPQDFFNSTAESVRAILKRPGGLHDIEEKIRAEEAARSWGLGRTMPDVDVRTAADIQENVAQVRAEVAKGLEEVKRPSRAAVSAAKTAVTTATDAATPDAEAGISDVEGEEEAKPLRHAKWDLQLLSYSPRHGSVIQMALGEHKTKDRKPYPDVDVVSLLGRVHNVAMYQFHYRTLREQGYKVISAQADQVVFAKKAPVVRNVGGFPGRYRRSRGAWKDLVHRVANV
ncbi:hypothetical protein SAICODRAFT_28011 [Saitoella complicata NRRL Y-17804]|nr:uncharacterized protein SAICODRAFT_28011 [Saitoella complicata NRRL Y-17804]ODQ49849.1 hypothetical protein SAICODRAFT_28011 [Saitoella complicata NRRL Y-17804]